MPAMQENHDDHHDKSNHEDDRLDVGDHNALHRELHGLGSGDARRGQNHPRRKGRLLGLGVFVLCSVVVALGAVPFAVFCQKSTSIQ